MIARRTFLAGIGATGLLSVLPAPTAAFSCGSRRVVVLGSSTAAGTGASDYAHSWAGLTKTHLATLGYSLTNLAHGGYVSYQCAPTGTWHPTRLPGPDPARNINAALALQPAAILVNLPTNDMPAGISVADFEANLWKIGKAAQAAGVPLWMTTTQPRTNLTNSQRANLSLVRDWVKLTYGAYALDFWTGVAAPDGKILPEFSAGDGTHVNDAGHQVFATRVITSNLPKVLCHV